LISPCRPRRRSCGYRFSRIQYLDSGKVLLKDAKDDDIFQGRLGPELGYWDGEG
jgi:hypothetical protein